MEKNRSPLVKITGNLNTQKQTTRGKSPAGPKNPKKNRTMNYKARTLSQ